MRDLILIDEDLVPEDYMLIRDEIAAIALKIATMTKRTITLCDTSSETKFPQMCEPQPVQLDCRLEQCRFHSNGKCTTVPAITLNENSSCICWTNLRT